MGVFFRHFANYSKTYGTLGGFIAFMTWFQWTSLAMLVGAEINAELTKLRMAKTRERNLREKKMQLPEISREAA